MSRGASLGIGVALGSALGAGLASPCIISRWVWASAWGWASPSASSLEQRRKKIRRRSPLTLRKIPRANSN